ncbi:hypothetical protein EX30DRAFT_352539 [Ascodesmis nigricans]|uniref:Uncharacterized protein n=1 Tax=Ascodesmis nigricans TaxID=341454 RepID=A0A4S2MI70_9PEZI|nr:hypothetical protein EX30DRAFT_352539 [Ascodesmis nigricans]
MNSKSSIRGTKIVSTKAFRVDNEVRSTEQRAPSLKFQSRNHRGLEELPTPVHCHRNQNDKDNRSAPTTCTPPTRLAPQQGNRDLKQEARNKKLLEKQIREYLYNLKEVNNELEDDILFATEAARENTEPEQNEQGQQQIEELAELQGRIEISKGILTDLKENVKTNTTTTRQAQELIEQEKKLYQQKSETTYRGVCEKGIKMSRPPSVASNVECRRSPSAAGSDYRKIDIRIRQPPQFTGTYPDNTSTAFATRQDEVEDYFIIKKILTAH